MRVEVCVASRGARPHGRERGADGARAARVRVHLRAAQRRLLLPVRLGGCLCLCTGPLCRGVCAVACENFAYAIPYC